MTKESKEFKGLRLAGYMHALIIGLLVLLLSSCGTGQSTFNDIEFSSAALTDVAWGEQVQVNHSAINASPTVKINYRIDNGLVQTITDFHQQNNRVVFALPEVLGLPALPNFSEPYTISASTYASALTSPQITQYSSRGVIEVTITAGSKKIKRNYQPFGTVEAGEVTVMAQTSNCNAFGNEVVGLGYTKVNEGSAGNLCYVTAGFNTRGTSQAISHLEDNLDYPNAWIDKNVVQALDPAGANSYDPSCDQISGWLDRAAGSGFDMLLSADLLASSNASAAHSAGVTGAGVNVFVIGGGIGANDEFECLDASGNILFEDHDTHVAEIIRLIAPDVNIEDRVVCNAAGNCPTSEIVMALLEVSTTAQNNSGKDLINMSLGGPVANRVLEATLKSIEPGITVITSNGNGPNAPSHYPASYSSGTPTPGSLDNVIAVAASGRESGIWKMAGFNTRNAEIFAPGTNVCVQTATGFRCDTSAATSPENLGITGSSFAAPIATGMAALYLEQSSTNLQPGDVRDCLVDSAQTLPNVIRTIWYDSTVCP